MKTLQDQYKLITEGKGHKDVFLKDATRLFPQYITNYASYNEAINILKQKNILNEHNIGGMVTIRPINQPDWFKIFNENIMDLNEVKEEVKPTKIDNKETNKDIVALQTKNYDYKDKSKTDNVYGTLYLNGFYAEMNDPKNKNKSTDEVKAIVTKNLSKDRLYYVTNSQFGINGIGYETEVPGLGTPKESTGKYKSSGYGDLNTETKPNKIKSSKTDLGEKEAKTTMPKKVEEMPITPKSLRGIKKMANWGGKEKKIKLKENQSLPPLSKYKENSNKWASLSTIEREDLLLKHIDDDPREYIEMDWDSLPEYVSTGISKDKQFINFKLQESKLRLMISQLISEILNEDEKTIKSHVQNGDKSYDIIYDDDTRDTIYVNQDGWDELNALPKQNVSEKLYNIIKEELDLKEIEKVGKIAEYEAKSRKISEEITKRRKKLKALTTLEEIESGSINLKTVKELKNDIKKLEKIKEKLDKKYTPKEEVIDEDTTIYTSDGTERTSTSLQKNTAKMAGTKGDTVVYKKKGT
jgi:hypothetical protein